MSEKENPLSGEESLKLINEMIGKAKKAMSARASLRSYGVC